MNGDVAQVLRAAADRFERDCEPAIAGMDDGYAVGYRAATRDHTRALRDLAGDPGARATAADRLASLHCQPHTPTVNCATTCHCGGGT